jgi:small multidrug resistance pump
MLNMPLPVIAMFAFTIFGQSLGLSLIPATRGFTAVVPTVVCIVSFISSFAVFARMVNGGVLFTSLAPVITVTLQLVVLIVGVVVYHEPASLSKIGLLVGAAIMIGMATTV